MGAAPPPGIPEHFGHPNIVIDDTEANAQRNSDPEAVFLLTAASRGLGLELAQQLLRKTDGHVVATCRDPDSAAALQDLAQVHRDRLSIIQLDVADQNSIAAAAAHVKSSYDGRLDALFNVAGLLGDGKSTPGPERSLAAIDRDWFTTCLQVNVVGPVMLAQAMAPYLAIPRKNDGKRGPSVIANFSARVGSISDNRLGGWHSYRMSKAALNQATKCLALELKRQGTLVFSYHPGTTDTDLSKPFQANVRPEKLFTPEFTVSRMLAICDRLQPEHSGGFYDYSGTFLLW